MLIKVPITQIEMYWELIKSGAVASDGVAYEDIPVYARKLMIDLLTEAKTCVLKCDAERNIEAMGIFSFHEDKSNDVKYMLLNNLFGTKQVSLEDWDEEFKQLYKLAIKEGCKYIRADSKNERLWDMMKRVGFDESIRVYTLILE